MIIYYKCTIIVGYMKWYIGVIFTNSKKLHVGYIHKIPKNDKQVIYPKLQRGYIHSLVRGYIK